MSDFFVGQKVVCIDGTPAKGRTYDYGEKLPVTGGIYTIRAIQMAGYQWDLHEALLLNEIHNPVAEYYDGFAVVTMEGCFRSERFRPLEEKPFESEWVAELARNLRMSEPAKLVVAA